MLSHGSIMSNLPAVILVTQLVPLGTQELVLTAEYFLCKQISHYGVKISHLMVI